MKIAVRYSDLFGLLGLLSVFQQPLNPLDMPLLLVLNSGQQIDCRGCGSQTPGQPALVTPLI